MNRRAKGFVGNEPLIVLVTLGVMCLLLGIGLSSVARWSVFAGIGVGASAFLAVLGAFWLWAKRQS